MALGIIFTALFASAFGIMYMYFTTRNRERMAMIDKGASIDLIKGTRQVKEPKTRKSYSALKFTLKFGLFLVGIGIGFIITVLLGDEFSPDMEALFGVGSAFVCGGIGLVAGFFIGRSIDKRDEHES